jgi:hypothetical protein
VKQLDLDFRKTRPASPWAGWVMLAIAVAFTADLGVSYYRVREASGWKEARLARLGPQASGANRAGTPSRNISAEEIAFARETIRRLSVPWDDLFGALESTVTDKIALLAIEPDPKSGTVVISGDGQDYVSALDYIAQLGRTEVLTHVHLVKHELRQDEPRQPVGFSVSASWKEAR